MVVKRPSGPGTTRVPVYMVRADGSIQEMAPKQLRIPCLVRVHDQFTSLLSLRANGVPTWHAGKQKDRHLMGTNRVAKLVDMVDTLIKEGLVKAE